MEKYEQQRLTKKQILFHNFLGGIAWGLGATVGVSLFLALIAFLVNQINVVPVVGDFVSNVYSYILQQNPSLQSQ